MSSTQTELVDIVMRISGEQDVKRLKVEIQAEEEAIKKLYQQLGNSPAAHAQLASASKQSAQNIAALRAELSAAEAKIAGADRSLKGLTGSSASGGRALLEFSRAAEDAQYGLSGILNNIPGLISALGGPAGLAGVASLVAVAFYQVYKNWDAIAASFTGTDVIRSMSEEMKLLAENTNRTVAETERLITLSEKDAAIKKGAAHARGADDAMTPVQQTTAKAYDSAIKDLGGYKAVLGEIIKHDPNFMQQFFDAEDINKVNAAQQKLEDMNMVPQDQRGRGFDVMRRKFADDLAAARAQVNAKNTDAALAYLARPGVTGDQDAIGQIAQHLKPDMASKLDEASNAGGKKFVDELWKRLGKGLDTVEADAQKNIDEQIRKNNKARKLAKDAADKRQAELDRDAASNEAFTLDQAKTQDPELYARLLGMTDPEGAKEFLRQRDEDLNKQGAANEREAIAQAKRQDPKLALAMLRQVDPLEADKFAQELAAKGIRDRAEAANLAIDRQALALDQFAAANPQTKGEVFGGGPAAFHDQIQKAILAGPDPVQVAKDQLEMLKKLVNINERIEQRDVIARFGPDN